MTMIATPITKKTTAGRQKNSPTKPMMDRTTPSPSRISTSHEDSHHGTETFADSFFTGIGWVTNPPPPPPPPPPPLELVAIMTLDVSKPCPVEFQALTATRYVVPATRPVIENVVAAPAVDRPIMSDPIP